MTFENKDYVPSQYAVVFDRTNPWWSDDIIICCANLVMWQNYFNKELETYGYIFLNKVYEALCFYETEAGKWCGWKAKELTTNGDGYVDIHVKMLDESTWVLDFNVDGEIKQKYPSLFII